MAFKISLIVNGVIRTHYLRRQKSSRRFFGAKFHLKIFVKPKENIGVFEAFDQKKFGI